VYAWALFRAYYLTQLPEGQFYKRLVPSPDFHYDIVRDVGTYQLNAIAAPRGSAKSTVLTKELATLLTLTRPYFTTLLLLSKDTMCTQRMLGESSSIGMQLENNPFIREDFGTLKPPRGSGPWNAHMLKTVFESMVIAVPVKGGSLGQRPDLILCDDPEVDPVLAQVSADLTENFERFLFNILMPMLDKGGSSLYWIGTLLSKACFLYYVINTRDDERFLYWNRRLLDVEDDGRGKLLWEAKWGHAELELEKSKLGLSAYNAQRRNRPGDAEQTVLKVHPELGQYEIIQVEDEPTSTPLSSKSVLVSWKEVGKSPDGQPITERIERSLGPTAQSMFRVLLMDHARCLSPTSDYIAMSVIGVENSQDYKNTWWHLDLKVGRYPHNTWVPILWELAIKWRVQYIGIEAVAAQNTLVDAAREFADRHIEGWVPRIVPIRYPHGLSKEDRISGLEWRFASSRIKFPRHKKFTWPYKELYHELEGFTGLPGATQHDDAIDTVAMAQFLVKGSGYRTVEAPESQVLGWNPLELLSRGEIETEYGFPAAGGIDISRIPLEYLNKILFQEQDHDDSGGVSHGEWNPSMLRAARGFRRSA